MTSDVEHIYTISQSFRHPPDNHFWKLFGRSHKSWAHISYYPDSLCIYLTKMCTYVHQKTHIGMFIAMLFIVAPNQKLPKCSLTTEWITIFDVFIHNRILYRNKNEWTTTMHNREKSHNISVSERSQIQEYTVDSFSYLRFKTKQN